MHNRPMLLVLTTLASGCSFSGNVLLVDDGGPGSDAGLTADSGPAPADTGPTPVDGGPTPVDAGPATCDGLDVCSCAERTDCTVLSDSCICLCDHMCTGFEICDCGCGGGTYLGCEPVRDAGPSDAGTDAGDAGDASTDAGDAGDAGLLADTGTAACDPYTAAGCGAGESCYVTAATGFELCQPGVHTGSPGDACSPTTQLCEIGSGCYGEFVGECMRYCGLGGSPDCADLPGTSCLSLGHATVGVCAPPM